MLLGVEILFLISCSYAFAINVTWLKEQCPVTPDLLIPFQSISPLTAVFNIVFTFTELI